jgi:hypothetical protein
MEKRGGSVKRNYEKKKALEEGKQLVKGFRKKRCFLLRILGSSKKIWDVKYRSALIQVLWMV